MDADRMGNAREIEPTELVKRFLVDSADDIHSDLVESAYSFVYVIQAGEDGPVKIGCAAVPSLRLGQLQCGSWQTLHLRAVIPCNAPMAIEQITHTIANRHRIRGEWFDVHPYEAVEFVLAAASAFVINGPRPSVGERTAAMREDNLRAVGDSGRSVGRARNSPEYIAGLRVKLGMD